jgi:hypothetical protein
MRTPYLDDDPRIAPGGLPASGQTPDVFAAAVTASLQKLYRFFVDQHAEILAMPRSFASVKQGLALAAEPPELINTVLSRLADRLNQARTAAELAERTEAYCRLGYIYKAMENENNDCGRRQLRLRPLSDDWDRSAEGPTGGEGPGDDDEDRRNLAVLVHTLRDRAERAAPSTTCLTTLHVRCWQAVVAGHGAQASLARELKVDPSRITQIKSSAAAKVRETLYVAGVLAKPGTLGDADRIHACLDVYDVQSGPRALTTEQRARLATAALAVKVSPAKGQRADSQAAADRYLRRKDKKSLRENVSADVERRREFETEFAESLHAAETAQSSAIGHPHPNCTLNCDPHNPQHDRVIWHIEWT